jgi:hypothetical protein
MVQGPLRVMLQGRRRAIVQAGRGAALLAATIGAIGVSVMASADSRPPASAAGAAVAPSPQASPAPSFDSARAWEYLEKQVAFGPRPAGSAALTQTRQWIVAELKAIGIDPRQQMFSPKTPIGEIPMINIIGTIPGRRPERIILASHYDTKRTAKFRFVGASDAASSTAALIELARALKQRQNEYTIEVLFLDGEEAVNWDWKDPDNTYGSRYYVQAARQVNQLAGIKALILLDMIGAKNLVVERDGNSTPWLRDLVWGTAATLGHRRTFSSNLTQMEDDHLPFVEAGVPSVDIIDLNHYARYWHTAKDDLDHVSEQSLKVVGDVVLASIPEIEKRLIAPR